MSAHGRVTAFLAVACLLTSAAAPGAEWRIVKPSNTGIPGEEVRFLRFAPDGQLWVGARWPYWYQGGVGICDLATQIWADYANWETPIPSEFVNDVEFGAGGVVWMATDGGLVRKDGDTWAVWTTANAPLLRNEIANLDLDQQGHVWLNNSGDDFGDGAIFEFTGTKWTRYRVGEQLPWAPPWYPLSDLLVDHNNHVWVANVTLNGVAEYDGAAWALHGSNVDRFGEIKEDTAGNIWLKGGIGGYNAFYQFNHISFTTYSEPTTPTTIGIDDDGAVYLGNWAGRVRKTTNGGQTWTDYLSGLNPIYNIEPDPGSTDVWIGLPEAVGHFRGDSSWVHYYNTYNTGLPWYTVDRFNLDRAGNLWVATGESGLSRFDGARWRNWGNHNAGSEPYPWAGNEPMGCFYLAADGVGWMGGNGVGRWDPQSGQFTGFWNWQNNPGMGVDLFTSFAEDAAGNLFGDQQGTKFQFNGTLWVPLADLSGPAGLQTDSHGNVWAFAGGRLVRWDGQSWSTVGPPIEDVSCMALGADDTIWLGTGAGLVHWDGMALESWNPGNSPLPSAYIAGVAVRKDGALGVSCVTDAGHSAVILVDGDIHDLSHWAVYSYGQAPLPSWLLRTVGFDAQGDLWVSCLDEGVAVLNACTSAGSVKLERGLYPCDGAPEVSVVDCDLNADPEAVETVTVVLASTSEPGGENVVLSEMHPAAGVFIGSPPLAQANAPGVLWVSPGDTLTATYVDADNGQGGHDIVQTATAQVDCQAPLISGVTVSGIESTSARISFAASEPVQATIFYGTSCGALNGHASTSTASTAPLLDLTGLTTDTRYYFAVQATDAVGQATYDNHGGGCYTFRTMAAPHAAYSFPLDTNPGWSVQGQWAWGHPTGGGSYNHDPSNGHTGTNVYGYNLSGDYANNMPEYHLTTTALDCSQLSEVNLRFWRWLGVQYPDWDHASLSLSTNGTAWTTIWENGGQITDSNWVFEQYDISAYADHQPTVYLRWTLGPTDSSYTFCGWNIDDIEIWGVEASSEPPETVAADLDCVPSSGLLPFTVNFTARLVNLLPGEPRRAAGRIDVNTGGGQFFSNWRSGWTTLAGDQTFTTTWNQGLPALGSLVGANVFTLFSRDVTHSPYNQPPYAPAGDTDSQPCTVTASSP